MGNVVHCQLTTAFITNSCYNRFSLHVNNRVKIFIKITASFIRLTDFNLIAVGFQDPPLGAVQTKYADLLGTGPLVVISSVVGSWIVHQQNLALGHLADLGGGVFAVQIHFQHNAASEMTFGEALWHHRTGGDIDDGIGPVQVVSEDRHN